MTNLYDQYLKTRAYTERICKPLMIEDYIPQPADFVSPPKWHLAHTSWFFEELVLKPSMDGYQIFHPDFSFLFNSYYNSLGRRTQRANRGDLSRPTVEEVYKYRQYVDKYMKDFILSKKVDRTVAETIILGINHEQQHQELLITDLKYTLSLNPLFPVYQKNFSLVDDKPGTVSNYIDVRAGNYMIGPEGEGFTYDNEHERHKVYLNNFKIASELVTNGEYLDFIKVGGYKEFNYWHEEAISWLNDNEITIPLYWHHIDDRWFQYSLQGLVELDMLAPLAHISYYEANAYAFWKGARLPTEEEWEVASSKFDWGKRWEWTQSAYLPYPGFKIVEGAIGEYNGKFMVNQKVLRGSSNATYPGHSRITYRNFFHPHLRWQLTGIRLAKDAE